VTSTRASRLASRRALPCLCPTCCAQFPERLKIKKAALRIVQKDAFMLSKSPKEPERRDR
jgi:hypothetical protein